MAMASQQIKNVFDVPPYENLETLADTMLEQEKQRLMLMERSLVDGSESSLDSLKLYDNKGGKDMEPDNGESKPPVQQMVVGDHLVNLREDGEEDEVSGERGEGVQAMEPVVGDNQVNYMVDGEDDEFAVERMEGEHHGHGDANPSKQDQQEKDMEGKKR